MQWEKRNGEITVPTVFTNDIVNQNVDILMILLAESHLIVTIGKLPSRIAAVTMIDPIHVMSSIIHNTIMKIPTGEIPEGSNHIVLVALDNHMVVEIATTTIDPIQETKGIIRGIMMIIMKGPGREAPTGRLDW